MRGGKVKALRKLNKRLGGVTETGFAKVPFRAVKKVYVGEPLQRLAINGLLKVKAVHVDNAD